jgi:CheY-like chemotaxis protein
MELEKVTFDLQELFESCRMMIAPKAAEKGIRLHFYAEPSVGKCPVGDPLRLRQVLLNILSNAVKFTNSGIIKVQTTITKTDDKSVTMRFEIKDSGIGMTPEQIKRIFEPFTQAETGTTRQYGGTGLGLTITKNILDMMGGKLAVESAPGIGSCFQFELTFETVDSAEGKLEKIMASDMTKPKFTGEVLLCEDNAMNQQVVSEHLARVGLKTVIAENGKIGVELVRERKMNARKQFDLIFMDIHMPVMDGLEASALMLDLDVDIPIVALTANIMSHDVELYKSSGMKDYVGKPFTSQELWRCLLKYFKPIGWQTVNDMSQRISDTELRKKLVQKFVKSNQGKFSDITAAIADGDVKLAHRLAHTLKGNAGQLGMLKLQMTAEAVETQLQGGVALVTPEQMEALERELSAALADLGPQAVESASPMQTKPLDAEETNRIISEITPLLKESNPECMSYIESLRRIPGSQELVRLIEEMEFEAALAELKRM